MKRIMIGSTLVIVLISSMIVSFGRSKEGNQKILATPIFPTGIFLCKGLPKIGEGWADAHNFKYEPKWRQREILKELEQLLVDISEKSYQVKFSENIRPDFDNKVTDVYFVPAIERIGKADYMKLYGAILYEKEGYKGKSQIICKYPQYTAGIFLAERAHLEKCFKPSSIKPFIIGSFLTKDKGWKITLYEKPRLNKESLVGARQATFILPEYFSCQEFELDWSPQSIEIKGELIAVLMKPNGESKVFEKTEEKLIESTATKLTIISGRIVKKIN